MSSARGKPAGRSHRQPPPPLGPAAMALLCRLVREQDHLVPFRGGWRLAASGGQAPSLDVLALASHGYLSHGYHSDDVVVRPTAKGRAVAQIYGGRLP